MTTFNKENLKQTLQNRLEKVATLMGDFYVKRLNVAEMDVVIKGEQEAEKRADFQGEAKFALYALDEQGNAVFDGANDEDLLLIYDLPFAVRASVANAFMRVNFGDLSAKND